MYGRFASCSCNSRKWVFLVRGQLSFRGAPGSPTAPTLWPCNPWDLLSSLSSLSGGAERAWRGQTCCLKALAQKWHTSRLLVPGELGPTATPAAREARDCCACGLPKTRTRRCFLVKTWQNLPHPNSFSALPSCGFMATPGRKGSNGSHL